MIPDISNPRIAVIGYGSWATALTGLLSKKGISIRWLVSNPEVRQSLQEEGYNCKYVSEMEINMKVVELSDNIDEVINPCNIVLLACPSAYLDSIIKPYTGSWDDKFIISAVKGIIPIEYNTVLEYMHDTYKLSFKQMGVISGPTHAEEVSRRKISYMTAAGTSSETTSRIAEMFTTDYMMVNTSRDIYGIEYAGVMKNVYAIAVGMAVGLGYGDNFLAVLTSSSAHEMERFINGSYPFYRKFTSREYLGDLLVTCGSNFSRNRRLGQLIGKGCSVRSAINEMTMIAEGYFSAYCIHEVNRKYGIELPIADLVYRVLYENESPRKAFVNLSKTL